MSDKRRRFGFAWIEEWSQIWTRCNWYEFTPICIEFENDKMFGTMGGRFILLGLGFAITCHYADTGYGDELARRLAEAQEEHQGEGRT